jgi:hypothetical protein
MNAPEMPGSIMAQIARDPERKTNQRVSGVWLGVTMVRMYAITAPIIKVIATGHLHFLISRNTSGVEIRINPKKNDQRIMG